MVYQPRSYDDQELGDLLSGASRAGAFPPTPDLASTVRARIEPTPIWYARAWATIRRHPAAASLVAALLTAVVSVSAFTDAPGAVADRFGVPGIQFMAESRDEELSLTPVSETGLQLGESMPLEDARSRAPFEFQVPNEDLVGQPRAVHIGLLGEVPIVSLSYRSGDFLDASDTTGLGLLVTQFPAELADEPFVTKGLPPDSVATQVDVNGVKGYWLDGGNHSFRYQTPDGEPGAERSRLAGNVLVWEENGYVYRIEGARTLPLGTAFAIAESMAEE